MSIRTCNPYLPGKQPKPPDESSTNIACANNQWNLRGGEEVLLDVGGQDATEAFEDVGHSDEAREILNGLKIGGLRRQVRTQLQAQKQPHVLISIFPMIGR